MVLEVGNLADLDQAQVDNALAFAVQLLSEKQENIDFKRGVIGDLVVKLDAILSGGQRANISLERQSHSLVAIEANPDLADDDIVNDVISNYRLTRRAAAVATGEVTIVLSQLVAVTIPSGSVFVIDGRRYTSDATYTARTAAENVVGENDRLISQLASDEYAFTINVTATVAGSAGAVQKDTTLVPQSAPTSFVKAYASSDFIGGVNAQTNADLIALLADGLAAKAWSNRVTIPSTARAADSAQFDMVTDQFVNIQTMSIVGFNDEEMARDQHQLFPVSGGGRCDIYLRSQEAIHHLLLTKTATLIDKVDAGGIWQLSIGRDDAPGFYEVTKVLVKGDDQLNSGYEVTEDIRGVDLTGDIYIPDIVGAQEAVYSRYQAATIRFLDTNTAVLETDVGVLTQEYDVTVSTMPLVKELQEFYGDRRVIAPAGDVVVKAAIPCFLSVSFEVQRRRTEAVIDEESIKSAMAAYVNTLGFPGVLYASALARVIDELLPDSIDAGAIDMFGRIRKPDGTISFIRGDDVITIPSEPTVYSTGRTVSFVLNTGDIAISDVTVAVPSV
jgi:hypothetical protein